MNENLNVIDTMLTQEGHEATSQAKKGIMDFSVLYAKKLIAQCLKGGKGTITTDDVRFAYQIMNKMNSQQYENQLNERRMKLINYTNKELNPNKFEKSPADVLTFNLYSQNTHMKLNWEYQIGFDNV